MYRFAAMLLSLTCIILLTVRTAHAQTTLHDQIDSVIERAHLGPFATQADDAEFLRRVYLDLAGTTPPVSVARSFLAETANDKRTQLIDQLLAAPEFCDHLADAFTIMLLERRAGDPISDYDWRRYLSESFRANMPWDQIAREILAADGLEAKSRPAMKFIVSRGATSYDALTRDIGRLLLGIDLQCAQCHDHPSISDYKQAHYYGIIAFINTTNIVEATDNKELLLVQKGLLTPVEFKSVFTGMSGTTGPQIPGRSAVEVPTFEKPDDAYEDHPRAGKLGTPKFFARQHLAQELASAENPQFARNLANRLWAMTMGRGLVEPLDLHHSGNPPTHPELLDLLAAQLVSMKFEVRPFMRELMLTKVYQRSSLLPESTATLLPETYAVAILKHQSTEQMLNSTLQATGHLSVILSRIDAEQKKADEAKFTELQSDPMGLAKFRFEKLADIRHTFLTAFANPPGEPEDDFNPTLSGALFFDNDKLLREWLLPEPENLIGRLEKLTDEQAIVDELYLTILTRLPAEEERLAVVEHLQKNSDKRSDALAEIAWGLLASSEFRLNH